MGTHKLKERTIFLILHWRRYISEPKHGDIENLVLRKHFDLFPLVSHSSESTGKGKSDVLFFLWNSRTDTEKDAQGEKVEKTRRRVLRKAFDYERVGGRTSVDVFPFIAIDRDGDRDSSRFSFLGPVLSRERAGEKARWRVLGIPWGERIEAKP